jgi:hypothetical protein
VTRLLVAGSCRSIHVEAFEGTNLLSRKLWVSIGSAICSWEVGYSATLEAAVVVAACKCFVVACSLRLTMSVDGAIFKICSLGRGREVLEQSAGKFLKSVRRAAIMRLRWFS